MNITDDEKGLIWSLYLMALQYITEKDNKINHMYMSAGEHCLEQLEKYGLVDINDRLIEYRTARNSIFTENKVQNSADLHPSLFDFKGEG